MLSVLAVLCQNDMVNFKGTIKMLTEIKYGNTSTFLISGTKSNILIDTDYAGTMPAFYKAIKDKGIKVCDRWLGPDGFIHFIEDMGMRPGPNYSIDRIDNEGDYCPENCRWATDKEQANNHSNNFIVEYNGRRQTLALWCEELSLPYGTIWMRFRRGWSAKRAFEQPLRIW